GLTDVELAEHGIVTATLAGTPGAPVIGLVAHVDTSPEAPGGGVAPIVHAAWDGGPIVLPGDPTQVLDPAVHPELAARLGHDIVTSDGTTLLGADDKAGVAEIMTALDRLARDDRPRATVRVGFTVDEETGRGADHFDIEAFGARCAYTFDGSGAGELETETFSAYEMVVTFGGIVVHPGTAKGLMVNAVKLAADFVASLPRDRLSPETTEGREGFVHPRRIDGDGDSVSVWLLVRDHDDRLIDEHVALVRRLAEQAAARDPRATLEVEVVEQYRNMGGVLEQHPDVVEAAREAIRRIGLEPVEQPIRGGTDGARLSERGLPTPNVFTGGQNYHSRTEWASVQDMAAAAATAVELVRIWGERA
ncbi:MAG: peptidase T, partial [Actinobacteria bacterium]|nr:peptidase T [Actinomycetota bacterium]